MKTAKQISQYLKSRPYFKEYIYEIHTCKGVISKDEIEDYINGKISTDEVLAMVSGEPTITEYDYEITPRTLGLGGGWNLRLLENGEEVGGGVFPLPEHCDFRDEKALQTLLDSLYEDALAEASAWLASR